MNKKFHGLVIMDGFGLASNPKFSAIEAQNYPNIKELLFKYPHCMLGASGLDVGLPEGQMGNSEVGHLNIGAGRVVYQELTKISKSIADGDFFENETLCSAINNAKNNGKKLHLFGLLSDGGVHSHIEHLFALIKLAKQHKLSNVYIHCFFDGRDVSPTSGVRYIKELQDFLKEQNFGVIASVMGRYYAMDRDNRWERVKQAYDCMTIGCDNTCEDAVRAIQKSYDNKVTDEFILPCNILQNGKKSLIGSGDSIIFFNFRPDRAREITRAFTEKEFLPFEREFLNPFYVCFTQYDATFKNVQVAFLPQNLDNTLGKVLADRGYLQFRIAETEKYAHVTFFFNGGIEKENKNETRVLINSPKVATYDLQPSMSANEVCDKAIELILARKFDIMICNFANCDMVGHTGVFEAAVKAVYTVDNCIGRLSKAILSIGGTMLLTSDHGNADKMYEDDGISPFTAHTTNPVPLILIDDSFIGAKLQNGRLCDIAPTLLDIMNEEKPAEMTGKSLIENK